MPWFGSYRRFLVRSGAHWPVGLAALLAAAPLGAQQDPPPAPFAPPPAAVPLQDDGLFASGFFLQMGFSFIVGLAVGFALKIAFKIALVVGGVLLVALFALQYAGLIDINWVEMESSYNGFAAWLGAYAGGLKDFMADHLSNTASFLGGLVVGVRL